jgi:hypothetical protein
MKTGLLILAVAACYASNGCAPKHSVTVVGPKVASVDTELIIYELVIRNLVADEPKDETILVSFGESWIDNIDPPESFFERLADVDVSLKPVSHRSQLSNPEAVLFVVRLIEWISETEVSVSVTRFRFGVGGSDGFTATVEWTDGVWRLAKTTGHWGT